MDPSPRAHHCQFETLESRTVLSASTLAATSEPANAVESAQDPIIIDSVHLRVGDRDVVVDSRNDVVIYKEGESLDVVAIDYVVSESGADLDGVVAFEGYLRERTDGSFLGEFDYSDGRFGDPSNSDPLSAGEFRHNGLEGEWRLADGTNRMSVALVRYSGDSWEAHDRFFVNLQEGEADLVLQNAVYKRSGNTVRFGATLVNRSETTVSTYSEVNVYHESDLSTPVWVGVFTRTLEAGKQSFGRYYNDVDDDGFDKHWKPAESGTYVVKFYADPENAVAETSEDNNVVVGKIRF